MATQSSPNIVPIGQVDTSSFTPLQLQMFNAAKALIPTNTQPQGTSVQGAPNPLPGQVQQGYNLPAQTSALQNNPQGGYAPQGTANPNYNPNATAGGAGSLDPTLQSQTAALQSTGRQYSANDQANPYYGGGIYQGATAEQVAALTRAGKSVIQWNANLAYGNPAENDDLLKSAMAWTPPTPQPDATLPQPNLPPAPSQTPVADQTLTDYLTPYTTALGAQTSDPGLVQTQNQLNALQNSAQASSNQLDTVPMEQGIKSGYQADVMKQNLLQQQPLQQKLARQQAMLQSAVDISKAALDYQLKQQEINKPFSVTGGSSVYSPSSRSFSGGYGAGSGINTQATGLPANATDGEIISYLQGAGIAYSSRNMPIYITAIRNGSSVQDIIGGKAGLEAATTAASSGNQAYTSPITGQRVYPTTTGGSGTPLASGASGTNVQALQQFLVSKGYMTQTDMNTGPGIYGPKTTAAVAAFQKAAGIDTSGGGVGVFGPRTLAAAQSQGYGGGSVGTGGAAGGGTQISSPVSLPTPQNYAQKQFSIDFTSGGLSDRINAQNTAAGHLVQAYALGQQMYNINLQGGNALKNWLASEVGQAAVNNYKQAHSLSESELSSAYGQDTAAERALNTAIGNPSSSPAQILGNVQTATALLSSKILSNIQQYKTAFGQNAPLNLNWFVSSSGQQALKQVGVNFKVDGNSVSIYQSQPDGSAKLIQ